MREILFYSTRDEYGWMSNFFASPIVLKGQSWPTTEHYFQAQKFAGTPHEDELRLTQSPMVVARMGRARARPSARTGTGSKTTSCSTRSARSSPNMRASNPSSSRPETRASSSTRKTTATGPTAATAPGATASASSS
jgi:hypothetical protein